MGKHDALYTAMLALPGTWPDNDADPPNLNVAVHLSMLRRLCLWELQLLALLIAIFAILTLAVLILTTIVWIQLWRALAGVQVFVAQSLCRVMENEMFLDNDIHELRAREAHEAAHRSTAFQQVISPVDKESRTTTLTAPIQNIYIPPTVFDFSDSSDSTSSYTSAMSTPEHKGEDRRSDEAAQLVVSKISARPELGARAAARKSRQAKKQSDFVAMMRGEEAQIDYSKSEQSKLDRTAYRGGKTKDVEVQHNHIINHKSQESRDKRPTKPQDNWSSQRELKEKRKEDAVTASDWLSTMPSSQPWHEAKHTMASHDSWSVPASFIVSAADDNVHLRSTARPSASNIPLDRASNLLDDADQPESFSQHTGQMQWQPLKPISLKDVEISKTTTPETASHGQQIP